MALHLERRKPIDHYGILDNHSSLLETSAQIRLRSLSPAHRQKKSSIRTPKPHRKPAQIPNQPPGTWELNSETHFLYDGWNFIVEFHKTSAQPKTQLAKKAYLWGLDLSGSLQGAGEVGRLLAITDHSTNNPFTYVAVYDGIRHCNASDIEGNSEWQRQSVREKKA